MMGKEKNLLVINVILLIVLTAIIVFLYRVWRLTPPATGKKAVSALPAPVRPHMDEIPAYAPEGGEAAMPQAEILPKNVEDIYANFPAEDVGVNIMKSWSEVRPEDKVKLTEGLDKRIASCRDELAIDPDNRKARQMLAISESLKKLVSNDFNYVPDRRRMRDEAVR